MHTLKRRCLPQLAAGAMLLFAGLSLTAQSQPVPAHELTPLPAWALRADSYLAESGTVFAATVRPWTPEATPSTTPDLIVAADGSGSHRTVQAAIDTAQVHQAAKDRRIHIRIQQGEYREVLCIRGKAPLLLDSNPGDNVRIVSARHRGQPKVHGESGQACEPDLQATTVSTTGSSTLIIDADDVTLRGFTIENDFDAQGKSADVQAVALTTRGDRILLEHMQLLGHQDTAQFSSATPEAIARVVVRDSHISGDTDFVFGRARAVFQRVRFHSRTDRISHGIIFAPSHPANSPLGFLVEDSIFTAGMRADQVALGRAWDHSQGSARDNSGQLHPPNGMLIVTRSRLGRHIAPQRWNDAATTRRPYSASQSKTIRFNNADVTFPANRLHEIGNTVDRYDPQTVHAKVVTQYPQARIAALPVDDRVKVSRNLIYSTRNDNGPLELALDIYAPTERNDTSPAVVLVHGGAWRTGQRENWAALAHALATRGIVAVPIDYRLSGEAIFPAAVHDIKSAVRWLRSNAASQGVRASCIALAGGSAGGHLAALSALTRDPYFDPDADTATTPASVQALINIDGLSDTVADDIRQFEDAPDKPFPALAQWLGGRYSEQPARWQQASPLRHVSPVAPPTLFLTSQEPRFSLGKQAMQQALATHQIASEEINFEAPHAFWLLDPWLQPTAEAIANFLQRCAASAS